LRRTSRRRAAFDRDNERRITPLEQIHIMENTGEPLPQKGVDEIIAEADA
jgi:Ca2+-binding EF-hand superfamily protein